jgi:hypothetical protein
MAHSMNQTTHSRSIASVFADFLGNFILVFVPLPIGFLRRKLAGRVTSSGDQEFYSHPNFVCTCHLVWVGWVVAAAGVYNQQALPRDWPQLPVQWMSWLWVVVVVLTMLVMGLKFGRVACGFLAAAATIAVLGITIAELKVQTPLTAAFLAVLGQIPMHLDWGVPMLTSLVLGLVFAAVATWQTVNDRWILPSRGHHIEHVIFQYRDRSISKGAKSFVAQFDCLVRRYLFFGYGDIEVRSSLGNTVVDRIEGVFFATQHAERMKYHRPSVSQR